MRRLILLVPFLLAACAESVHAREADVRRAYYHHDGPPALTFLTVIDNRNGGGAHTGLMVNADQRVMFDPAGSYAYARTPERDDVHYGMTPTMFEAYVDYHARKNYDVVIQRLEVSPEVAAQALRLIEANGAVPKVFCTRATTGIVRQLPGFEDAPHSFFPKTLMNWVAKQPGVTTRRIFDPGDDDTGDVLAAPA